VPTLAKNLPLKKGDRRKAEIKPLLENCPIKECMTILGTKKINICTKYGNIPRTMKDR